MSTTQDRINKHNNAMFLHLFGKEIQATERRRKIERAIRENAGLFATIYISKSDVGEKFEATMESLLNE